MLFHMEEKEKNKTGACASAPTGQGSLPQSQHLTPLPHPRLLLLFLAKCRRRPTSETGPQNGSSLFLQRLTPFPSLPPTHHLLQVPSLSLSQPASPAGSAEGAGVVWRETRVLPSHPPPCSPEECPLGEEGCHQVGGT